MASEYVLTLNDAQASLALVGGKGASLARLASAWLPVPSGFHVTTTAYQQFVAENNLQPAILAALEAVDAFQPATLDSSSRTIQSLFIEAKIPPTIVGAIVQAYATLPGDDPAVAVRSSATAEDLPELSFAGQQETYLNVQGISSVLDAVRRCWASLWTARAIGYRVQHGIDQEAVSLAVVVQVLVPAEAAGILFTANPVTGQREQAMISASWGLGEAVVSGQVTPDTLVVDKASGRILSRETADKQVMTVRIEGGTEEQPVPEALRHAPVLSNEAAAQLVGLGVQIEQLYDMPMDIEWTLSDGVFGVVQARPITALPEPEVPVATEWELPDPKGKYARGSILEFLPDPMTPLFATLGRDAIDIGTRRLFRMLAGRDLWPDGIVVNINGYAYFHAPGGRKGVAVLIGSLSPKTLRLLKQAEQRWLEEGRAPYLRVVERWQSRPVGDLSAAEILTGARAIMDAAVNLYTILQSGVIGAAMGSEVLFARVYDRLIKRPDDPAALTYVLGFDSMPILAAKALYDLAEWCRTRPALAAYISSMPARQLAAELDPPEGDSVQMPQGVEADDWREWQSRFRGYKQEYGHTIYNLDFANPVPADDPTPLLETCKRFLSRQIGSPYERQQAMAEQREQATQAMLQRLRGLRLKLFRKLVNWVQEYAPLREDGIADLGLGYPLLRQMLLELGRRLVQASSIDQAADIFWLYEAEARQAAAAFDRGEPVARLAECIPQRKAVWQAERKLTPPSLLPPSTKWMGINMEAMLPAHAGDQTGDTLRGTGTSPGRVTAPARVLQGTEDFEQMNPGEVLVARITTPAWTPLFAMASAVVTDVGGPLSHGSIVAREYGIPAVLGTGMATQRIRNGQLITVDGGAGTITLSN